MNLLKLNRTSRAFNYKSDKKKKAKNSRETKTTSRGKLLRENERSRGLCVEYSTRGKLSLINILTSSGLLTAVLSLLQNLLHHVSSLLALRSRPTMTSGKESREYRGGFALSRDLSERTCSLVIRTGGNNYKKESVVYIQKSLSTKILI